MIGGMQIGGQELAALPLILLGFCILIGREELAAEGKGPSSYSL
jgi:hypothetical protein